MQQMKYKIFIAFAFLYISCNTNYEAEEDRAINDIANEYLKRSREMYEYDDSKIVFISDALMPISQVKQDQEWMFRNKSYKLSDSIKFFRLIKLDIFNNLKYREFDRNKISILAPYKQSKSCDVQLGKDEIYKILKFSRVSFDHEMKNGIVVIDYTVGDEHGINYGYNGALLIKKENGKWKFIRD